MWSLFYILYLHTGTFVLYITVFYHTELSFNKLYYSMLLMLCCAYGSLHYTKLRNITLGYTTLRYATQHCFTLQDIPLYKILCHVTFY